MAEILVLVEHTDAEVKRVTGELLTAAARVERPSAAFSFSAPADVRKAGT